MIILGGGPIGLEFAQIFARFGADVTVIEMLPHILPREDPEVAAILEELLKHEGIKIYTNTRAARVEEKGEKKVVSAWSEGKGMTFQGEEILVATGRAPNVEQLHLEAAGVTTTKGGIIVNDHLQTRVKNIWACGDITGKYLFTHMADYQARVVVGNALFPFRRKANYRVVPWTTYTDPEVARVGLTEEEAREEHGAVSVYRHPFGDLDRAIIEGENVGFVKIVCTKNGMILGGHIIGPGAGELIHEVALAMKEGIKIGKLSQMIHVYPTLSEGIRRAADGYYREKLFSGWTGQILKKVFVLLR